MTTRYLKIFLYLPILLLKTTTSFSPFVSKSSPLSNKVLKNEEEPTTIKFEQTDNYNNNRHFDIINRRWVNANLILAILCIGTPSYAASNTQESIRSAASKIPGYGSPDVFYPSYFRGKWIETRANVVKNETVQFPIRFIEKDDDKIISDRAYNTLSYFQNDKTVDRVNNINWDSSNPNVQTINFADGSIQEVKVTKRSFDMDTSSQIFFVSEYQRVTKISPKSQMIPIISANRIVTKWKQRDEDAIEGMELVYDMGGGGDPLVLDRGAVPNGPKLISKSFIRLERLTK